jgi:hypothetical protein
MDTARQDLDMLATAQIARLQNRVRFNTSNRSNHIFQFQENTMLLGQDQIITLEYNFIFTAFS